MGHTEHRPRDTDPAGAQSIDAWRRTVLDRVLLLSFALTTFITLALIRDNLSRGGGLEALLALSAVAWVGIGIVAFRKTLDHRLRALGFVSSTAIACLGAVAQNGFHAPNILGGLAPILVILALVVSTRAAWWMLGFFTVSLTLIAGSWVTGGVNVSAPIYDITLSANWMRAIFIFMSMSAVIIASVGYLVERLEQALLQSESLLVDLNQENARKLQALEQQHTLEVQLRQSQKLESLGQMAGGVAHDFNNVLAAILSCTELVKRRVSNLEILALLGNIREAGERGASLSSQLLAFSRHQVAERTLLDLNATVQSSLELVRRLLPSNIETELDLCEGVGIVRAASIEIDQVLMNLCLNACDAMPRGGRLLIRTERRVRDDASWLSLIVRDTGSGMNPAEVERIFEPFYTTKDSTRGTGLGLSVVHGIVSACEGTIEVDSRLGQGSEFRVSLRALGDEIPVETLAGEFVVPESREASDHTLIVVDDDEILRKVIGMHLEQAGYTVILCADGQEALRCYRKQAEGISLVISDVVMPRMGAAALYSELSALNPDLPFLVCSGYSSSTLSPEFFGNPRCAFLAKPFTEQALLDRVRALLDVSSHS